MKNNKDFEKKSLDKLNRIIELLENLLIVAGASQRIKKHELRKIAGVGMGRVTKITRFIKEPRVANEKAKS